MPPLALLLALMLPLFATAASTPHPSVFNCTAHRPIFTLPSPPPGADCLRLFRHPLPSEPDRFARCRTETCYLFLQEVPFALMPPEALAPSPPPDLLDRFQRPFPCGRPQELHPRLRGIAFKLHALTSSKDALCIWAGPIHSCSFNALVDFIRVMAEHDPAYKFAITGLLLETQLRHCFHHPSAPFMDNKVVIVGRSAEQYSTQGSPLYQLVRPFQWATWGVFGAFVIIFLCVCFYIAVRFHVFPGRSFVSAFYILAGERQQAMSSDELWKDVAVTAADATANATRTTSTHLAARRPPPAHAHVRSLGKPVGKYGLALTLFSASLVALGAVFALFYEIAVVNFLFQQQAMEIDKEVRSLSVDELRRYAVLKNSALEQVWNAAVNPDGQKFEEGNYPWKRCDDVVECLRLVADEGSGIDFDVTSDIAAKYVIAHDPKCENLTLFRTKDLLYQFSAGWLYNERVDKIFRKEVNGQLVGLRTNGQTQSLVDEAYGDYTPQQKLSVSIGPLIVLIPLGIFVLPPLIASVLVVTCWPSVKGGGGGQRGRDRQKMRRLRFGRRAWRADSSSGKSSKNSSVDGDAGGKADVGGLSDSGTLSRLESAEGAAVDAASQNSGLGGECL